MQNIWGILTDMAMVALKRKFLSGANFCSQKIGTGTRGTHFFRNANTHKPLIFFLWMVLSLLVQIYTPLSIFHLKFSLHFYFLLVSGKLPCSYFVYVTSKVIDAHEAFSMYITNKEREKRDEEKGEREENGKERKRTYIKGTSTSLEKQ